MTKLRKQRIKKRYRYNVNRKRMRNKMFSVGNIGCKQVKQAWDEHRSVKSNLKDMGLSYDPNETIKIPSTKKKITERIIANQGLWVEETIGKDNPPEKLHVAHDLEKEAKAPRAKLFRLPNSQVEWITYLMDKYGDDFKAMTRDKRNYNQETWKQLRAKIKRFKSIPEQYLKYAQEKCVVNNSEDNICVNDDSD